MTHPGSLAARLVLLVAIAVAVVSLTACSVEPPASLDRVSHPATLAGTTWRLLSIQGRPLPAGPDVTLAFDDDRVSGRGACNWFGGQFTYEPTTGAVSVSRRVSTLRECLQPARTDLESAYLVALAGAAVATMDSDAHLVLGGSGGELVFEVGPRPAGAPIEASPAGSTNP
jgi:heat shock protein HslJ